MAFPTASEIAQLGRSAQMNSPLANIGRIVAGGLQGYNQAQERRDKKQASVSAKENQVKSAALLKQAVENPEQSEDLFLQAYQADPEFVTGFMQANKIKSEGMEKAQGKPITDYQAASLELRREQIDLDKLKAQQARESNELKKEQLQVAIDAKKTKLDQEEKAIADSVAKDVATFDSTLATVDQLMSHEGLESAVGASSMLPTLAGSEAANFEAKLEQLKGQQFLSEVTKMKGMGALSENEGKKLAAAASSLELSMSEDAFKKELKYIQDTMKKARDKISKNLPKEEKPDNGSVQLSPSAMKYLGGQ